jgi:hypothetical protein
MGKIDYTSQGYPFSCDDKIQFVYMLLIQGDQKVSVHLTITIPTQLMS